MMFIFPPFSNISATNYQNWMMYVEATGSDISVVFWGNSVCYQRDSAADALHAEYTYVVNASYLDEVVFAPFHLISREMEMLGALLVLPSLATNANSMQPSIRDRGIMRLCARIILRIIGDLPHNWTNAAYSSELRIICLIYE